EHAESLRRGDRAGVCELHGRNPGAAPPARPSATAHGSRGFFGLRVRVVALRLSRLEGLRHPERALRGYRAHSLSRMETVRKVGTALKSPPRSAVGTEAAWRPSARACFSTAGAVRALKSFSFTRELPLARRGTTPPRRCRGA